MSDGHIPSLAPTAELLRHHYDVETELAARLRNSDKAERLQLYRTVYDELYRRVPHHPMLSRKVDAAVTAARVAAEIGFLDNLLVPGQAVLEIGCGDCALSFSIASRVQKVFGLEVSEVIAASVKAPTNFELVISDGTSVPLPAGSVDLAYSNQLMEHLHPDDAKEQLHNIFRVLRPGGLYVCRTPHRLQGPTDISYLFDDVAAGLHLKEYTYRELDCLFRQVGFDRTETFVAKSNRYYRVSMPIMRWFESAAKTLFGWQSYSGRQAWLRHRPFNVFQQSINIVGYKA
jgi:SAM-dependent methyltransferase